MGIRARFAEYVYRFLQLASRYEEDTLRMTNNVWYPCTMYISNGRTGAASLGSGIRFNDEIEGMRELSINGARIEGWRESPSYKYWVQVYVCSLKIRFTYAYARILQANKKPTLSQGLIWNIKLPAFEREEMFLKAKLL
jgi:hypothetical protein